VRIGDDWGISTKQGNSMVRFFLRTMSNVVVPPQGFLPGRGMWRNEDEAT